MSLTGTMVNQIKIKTDADVFHELFRYNPYQIPDMTPQKIQACDLHDGEWGTVGSVISWNYFLDGKKKVAKEIIEAIDEEKKSVCFKVIGGDLLELYKSLLVTVHVDTMGEDNLVTWTLEYEKLNENVGFPTAEMDLCLGMTKDIESHHLTKSK